MYLCILLYVYTNVYNMYTILYLLYYNSSIDRSRALLRNQGNGYLLAIWLLFDGYCHGWRPLEAVLFWVLNGAFILKCISTPVLKLFVLFVSADRCVQLKWCWVCGFWGLVFSSVCGGPYGWSTVILATLCLLLSPLLESWFKFRPWCLFALLSKSIKRWTSAFAPALTAERQ